MGGVVSEREKNEDKLEQGKKPHEQGTSCVLQGKSNFMYWFLAEGGLIYTQSNEMMIESKPDHTKTTVGTFPRLPINPFANGYKWQSTQKLKNTPPRSLLHCGNSLYNVLATPTAIAIVFIIKIVIGGTIKKLHFTT